MNNFFYMYIITYWRKGLLHYTQKKLMKRNVYKTEEMFRLKLIT